MQNRASRERILVSGGYTVDGFGFHKKLEAGKELGEHHCKYCYSQQTFILAEEKYVAKALFLSVGTFKTNYAVVCSQCQNGYYVDKNQYDALLYQGAKIDVDDDGISITLPGKEVKRSTTNEHADRERVDSKHTCPKCGMNYSDDDRFCAGCGARLK